MMRKEENTSPGSRTPSCGFEDRRASVTLARPNVVFESAVGLDRPTRIDKPEDVLGSRVLRGESNPHLLVHSQTCRNRYTTRTMLFE